MSEINDIKAAELRRTYLREWRRKNPQKVRQYNQKYWLKKADKAKEEEMKHEVKI